MDYLASGVETFAGFRGTASGWDIDSLAAQQSAPRLARGQVLGEEALAGCDGTSTG